MLEKLEEEAEYAAAKAELEELRNVAMDRIETYKRRYGWPFRMCMPWSGLILSSFMQSTSISYPLNQSHLFCYDKHTTPSYLYSWVPYISLNWIDTTTPVKLLSTMYCWFYDRVIPENLKSSQHLYLLTSSNWKTLFAGTSWPSRLVQRSSTIVLTFEELDLSVCWGFSLLTPKV